MTNIHLVQVLKLADFQISKYSSQYRDVDLCESEGLGALSSITINYVLKLFCSWNRHFEAKSSFRHLTYGGIPRNTEEGSRGS